MELKLKFARDADVRRYNVAKFDPGLPPFGATFRQPGHSFHEVASEEEEDEEQLALRKQEDAEREALRKKGGPRNPDEWRMKGMRDDATDVSWMVEDSSNTVGYSGKLLPQKRAQYVVMVARKQSKEVLVMPVENWFKFDRQTKKKSAERRLQEQRARTNFQGEDGGSSGGSGRGRNGSGAGTTASRAKPSALDLIAERTGAQRAEGDQQLDDGEFKLEDDGSQGGASDVDDGMEFEGANSDDDADARIQGMGKRESESEGEPGLAEDAKEGKGMGLGRKFAEAQDNSDSDLDPLGQSISDSDSEQGRSYHKIDATWASEPSDGSEISDDESPDGGVDGPDEAKETVSEDAAPQAPAAPPAAAVAAAAPKDKIVPPAQKPSSGVSAAKSASANPPDKGTKRPRESPPPADRPPPKKPSLVLNRPKSAAAPPALQLEEKAIAAYLRSRKVSMKEFLGAFDKDLIKSKEGKVQLKVILKKLGVKTDKDPKTKEAFLVLKPQ